MAARLINLTQSPLQIAQGLQRIRPTQLILFLFVQADRLLIMAARLINLTQSPLQIAQP